MLKEIRFEKFTAFEDLRVGFSPGINVFIGENGTGKTHILKAAYAACNFDNTKGGFARKLNDVFYPSRKQIGRLVKRRVGNDTGKVEVSKKAGRSADASLQAAISVKHKLPQNVKISGTTKKWDEHPIEAVYIPVKDMMANAPGFNSLYEAREIHFEEIYVDILRKAFLPILKGPMDKFRKSLMEKLREVLSGTVVVENEEFFLYSNRGGGKLEFTLLAEGYRKLGLLWVLIQNGVLSNGSALFWDEPETNLNPKLMRCVIEILLELHRHGVQIFLATHDYILLKEFDLQAKDGDSVVFHSLYRDEDSGEIGVSSTGFFSDIAPNAIDDTYGGIVDREIARQIEGAEK